MFMRNAAATRWLGWALIALVGCDSESDERAGQRDGGGGAGGGARPTAGATANGAGGMPASPAWLPGGDTSDLGSAGGPGCSSGGPSTFGPEFVSFEEARARGFDPDALRSQIEGVFEADVQWEGVAGDAVTRVRVELVSDASARIIPFECPKRNAAYPACYAGDRIALDLHVSITTDDNTLQGNFVRPSVGYAHTRNPVIRNESGDEVLFGLYSGREPFVGTFALDPGAVAAVHLAVWTAPGREPRAQVRVKIPSEQDDERYFYALPVDGCAASESFSSEPGTAPCWPLRSGAGFCCGNQWRFIQQPANWEIPFTPGTNLKCLAPGPEDDAGAGDDDLDAGALN
jgi:hypothetical protein